MNDLDIIKQLDKEYRDEETLTDRIWRWRSIILIITVLIVITGFVYMAVNLEIIKRNPVSYCKQLFTSNGCIYSCDSILLDSNETAMYDSLHRGVYGAEGNNFTA